MNHLHKRETACENHVYKTPRQKTLLGKHNKPSLSHCPGQCSVLNLHQILVLPNILDPYLTPYQLRVQDISTMNKGKGTIKENSSTVSFVQGLDQFRT